LGAINRDDYVDATFSLLNLDEEFILEDLLLNFEEEDMVVGLI